MRPDENDSGCLWDILNAANLIRQFLAGMDINAFKQDIKTQSAVIRQQEIIGEATKQLSHDFRSAHPNIPWREIAGMRDILIHAYKKVKLDRVWYTATEDIPKLAAYIEPLLPPDKNV